MSTTKINERCLE
jgi:hypothetical protein